VKIVRPKIAATPPPPGPPAPGAAAPEKPETRTRTLVPPRAPSSAKTRNKVLLSVLDGHIEWEKMSPESRKAFEELFKDKEFLSQFGLTGKEKAFDPEQMKSLYDGISMMYKTVVGMALRWPAPALKMLGYSDEQKNMLAGPTANLANKFAPAFLVKHQELLIWGGMFAAVTQANFIQASAEAKKLIAQERARGGPQGVRPIVQTPAPADRPAPVISVPFAGPPMNGEGDPASLG
jgi:hypothetical protein